MKNKIKKNPIGKRQTNRNQAPVADVPADWFYMSDAEITVAAIKEALADTAYNVEYWEAAQVLEIVLRDGSSMDVEVTEPRLGEEEADAFLEEHHVKLLCYVTFRPEDYEAARSVMEHICGRIGGFFCGDTEDFTPVIKGQE